jgi:hypothetical protein
MHRTIRSTWKKVTFPFALIRAYNRGEGELFFTLGLQPQTAELGGIELVDYGTTRKVADLPFTKLGYQGSEATAPWRKAAEARIDKLRKGDLTIVVKNASGRPVANAEVAIHMRKHAFLWGTAVSGIAFTGGRMPQENLARYKEEIRKNFNFAVMENETKWPQWANEASRPGTLATIDWLRENGLQVRGHNLVWPSWRNTNVKAATDARDNPAALAKVITDHIAETTTALRGRLVDWDVINETFTNHDFMDILGRHAMVDWFQAARVGDPGAKLYINDFNILETDDKPHQDDSARAAAPRGGWPGNGPRPPRPGTAPGPPGGTWPREAGAGSAGGGPVGRWGAAPGAVRNPASSVASPLPAERM